LSTSSAAFLPALTISHTPTKKHIEQAVRTPSNQTRLEYGIDTLRPPSESILRSIHSGETLVIDLCFVSKALASLFDTKKPFPTTFPRTLALSTALCPRASNCSQTHCISVQTLTVPGLSASHLNMVSCSGFLTDPPSSHTACFHYESTCIAPWHTLPCTPHDTHRASRASWLSWYISRKTP